MGPGRTRAVAVAAVVALAAGVAAWDGGGPAPAVARSSSSHSVTSGTAAPAARGESAAGAFKRTHSFVTEPGFHPPVVRMSGKDTDTASGDIVLSAENSHQPAPYLLNGKGSLLWYGPLKSSRGGLAVFNVRVQRFQGRPVITYWRGTLEHGLGHGEDVILDRHYRTIDTVTAGDGYQKQGTDLHEFTLGRQGSQSVAFVPIWKPVRANLTSVGGPSNGTAIDWIIQEIDLKTNKVIWEWHALKHVPVDDTYNPYVRGQALDYFHLNSIQQLSNGHLIISARNTWAVYSIDMKSGKVVWELGGKHSSFSIGSGARFEWQHDATLHRNGLLTVFDDAFNGVTGEESQSRALEIELHMDHRQATLVHAFQHNPSTLASSGGSVQVLANHDIFVGWGAGRFFSEYTPSGRQIFSGSFVKPIESYRTYREPWTGAPPWTPAVAVRTSTAHHYVVYASWNGATQVAHWQVLVGQSASGPFTAIKRAKWSGFETKIPVSTHNTYFEVKALGARGKVLLHGTSAVVQPAQ